MGPRTHLWTMVHDLSPFLIRFSGDIGIRWYGLSYIMGFLASYYMISWLAQRQRVGLTPQMVGDFITYGAIGVLVGGRLGYCVFYNPELFIQFRSSFPFWGVLAVNEGGMASHGGIIGLVLATTIFAIRNGLSQLYLYDLIAIVGPIGIFFGRMANFINGELVGRPADPTFPLAVRFPQDIFLWPKNEFAKLPALGDVISQIPGYTKDQWLEWVDKFRSDVTAREAVNAGLTKIVDAIQSGNVAAKEAIGPLLEPRHPSQLYAGASEGLFLFLCLFLIWYKPRRPGVIGAWFVILYAIVRIVNEQFRMPDDHLGYQLFNLTRGQWLSIGMLFVGFALLFIWGRRDRLPTPGWGRGQNVKIGRR